MANDWLKYIPFVNRKYRDARLHNAKNVPWGNQDIKNNIPDAPTNQQLRDVYKQRVRQNIKYNTPADPAFPWQERTRLPTPKPSTPKGIPTPNSPAQLKRLVENLQKAKPPKVLNIPLPRGITIPKVPIRIPPGLGKAAGVGGSIYQLASEAPRTWKAIESMGVDIWSIITSGAGLVPDIARQPWWQEFAKAVVERKRELMNEQGLIRPSSTTEVEPATYPFKGGQSAVIYVVTGTVKRTNENVAPWQLQGQFAGGKIYGIVIINDTAFLHHQNSPATTSGQSVGQPQYQMLTALYDPASTRNIISAYFQLETVKIGFITRPDGQPDTEGNPPPTTAPVTSEPWIPVPVTAIPVSDLIPEPVTEPATTDEVKPLSPSPFGGIPFVPTMLPIPNEGINEGLAPSQSPLTPNSPSVDDQTAPFVKKTTYAPGSDTTGTSTDTTTNTETKEKEKKVVGKLPSLPSVTLPPLFTPVLNGSKPSNQIAPKSPEPTVTPTPGMEECQICNQPIINNQDKIVKNQNKILERIGNAADAVDLSLLPIINQKLGDQLPNGISGYFKAAWEATRMDKVINLLTLIMTIHNAAMLSRNLGETLGDAASGVLRLLGIVDHEKKFIDVNQVIGNTVTGLIKDILGEEVYRGISKKWNLANRIVTAGMGVVAAIHNMVNAALDGINTIASWIAKMGNRAQEQGIVDYGSWPWMNENTNFRNPTARFLEKVDNLEEAADSVYMLVSSGIELQEGYTEAVQATKDLTKALDDFDSDKKIDEGTVTIANQSPTPTKIDVVKHETEEQ